MILSCTKRHNVLAYDSRSRDIKLKSLYSLYIWNNRPSTTTETHAKFQWYSKIFNRIDAASTFRSVWREDVDTPVGYVTDTWV